MKAKGKANNVTHIQGSVKWCHFLFKFSALMTWSYEESSFHIVSKENSNYTVTLLAVSGQVNPTWSLSKPPPFSLCVNTAFTVVSALCVCTHSPGWPQHEAFTGWAERRDLDEEHKSVRGDENEEANVTCQVCGCDSSLRKASSEDRAARGPTGLCRKVW